MKSIEYEVLLTFLAFVFGLMAVGIALDGKDFPPLLYVSVLCLSAAKVANILPRIDFKRNKGKIIIESHDEQ